MQWERDEAEKRHSFGRQKGGSFFEGTRPGRIVSHGAASFELPILYFRDDFFALYFSADARKVSLLVPSDNLHPVLLPNKKAVVAVGAFNYLETSIGPYGEVIVGVPVVYGKEPVPLLPAMLESRYPGFGVLVLHLPVTTKTARDAGRGEWGYTKFVADMRFSITPEFQECEMSENGESILTLRVARKGFFMKDRKPIHSYSVKEGRLIRTTIPQKGAFRQALRPGGSFLRLGRHPVSEAIRNMGLSERPLLSKYYVERAAVLPAGEAIEENVSALDGYFGEDREGERIVSYIQGHGGAMPHTSN
jgi:hypothetical protein